jgi:hypothetical protein
MRTHNRLVDFTINSSGTMAPAMSHAMSHAITPLFPAAMRAMDALAPAHARFPAKVAHVASLLEESMQAYGRCLLASAGSPVKHDDTGTAVREAEEHMLWRARLRTAVDAVSVGSDAAIEHTVKACEREIDHLMYTLDRVLVSRNVHCSAVSSGIHA